MGRFAFAAFQLALLCAHVAYADTGTCSDDAETAFSSILELQEDLEESGKDLESRGLTKLFLNYNDLGAETQCELKGSVDDPAKFAQVALMSADVLMGLKPNVTNAIVSFGC